MDGRDPKTDEECACEQLSRVDAISKRDLLPYVDFLSLGAQPPQVAEEAEEHRAEAS